MQARFSAALTDLGRGAGAGQVPCAVHLFFTVPRALSGSAGPAISSPSRGRGWFACAVPCRGSSALNYHLMATPGPRPSACLSCEKDLEEPTSGFDRRNCRLIEAARGEVGGFSFRPAWKCVLAGGAALFIGPRARSSSSPPARPQQHVAEIREPRFEKCPSAGNLEQVSPRKGGSAPRAC